MHGTCLEITIFPALSTSPPLLLTLTIIRNMHLRESNNSAT